MKIYTKTGDAGQTSLFGGERVFKTHPRVEAYGAVDELNSVLGVLRSRLASDDLERLVARIQNTLFDVGAQLATPRPDDPKLASHLPAVSAARVEELEDWIDRLDADLPALRAFVLPGGVEAAAWAHVARSVCRRAERRVVALASTETVDPEILRYLNRLGDLLFVMARWLNRREGVADIEWERGRG
ncbi:MAG: cob(I)yrinic acid a,c-diamide adenosyltransferase [Armatimonadota bacterium]|nr:cob(I)yrinic acid a,c-diamide adenosyltransferase [Armatimonadota bacterium]MDR5697006.1 cob(I)yrinic acid a,c-diamide adenosyltransferase [Armatimonadota bacterium]